MLTSTSLHRTCQQLPASLGAKDRAGSRNFAGPTCPALLPQPAPCPAPRLLPCSPSPRLPVPPLTPMTRPSPAPHCSPTLLTLLQPQWPLPAPQIPQVHFFESPSLFPLPGMLLPPFPSNSSVTGPHLFPPYCDVMNCFHPVFICLPHQTADSTRAGLVSALLTAAVSLCLEQCQAHMVHTDNGMNE